MEEVLVEGFNVKITRHHLTTLADSQLLGDEVINFYRELLQEREMNAMTQENRTRQVWFTNTFFITKLTENGYTYRNVRRYAKVDIFSLRLMLLPKHTLGGVGHWTCAAINFHDKTITYYDSMGGKGENVLQTLLRYLKDEHENKKHSPLPNPEEYQLISLGNSIPQQSIDSLDCGVFMCQFLNYLSNNDAFNFNQSHISNFRMKMCLELFNKQLFD